MVIHLSPGIYIQSTLWHHENYFDHAIIVRKNTLWHHDTGTSVAKHIEPTNTGQDRGQLIEFGHCPGQHCRPIRKTLIWNTRKVSLDNLILSAFLKERDNMASFSNSDSCAPRLISLKTDCGFLWVQGLVEAIESPWFLWRMFKKSNFALVAPNYWNEFEIY